MQKYVFCRKYIVCKGITLTESHDFCFENMCCIERIMKYFQCGEVRMNMHKMSNVYDSEYFVSEIVSTYLMFYNYRPFSLVVYFLSDGFINHKSVSMKNRKSIFDALVYRFVKHSYTTQNTSLS